MTPNTYLGHITEQVLLRFQKTSDGGGGKDRPHAPHGSDDPVIAATATCHNRETIGLLGASKLRPILDKDIKTFTKFNTSIKCSQKPFIKLQLKTYFKDAFTIRINKIISDDESGAGTPLSMPRPRTMDTQWRHKSKISVKLWQTKYASAVPKNLGVGVNFRPCSEGYFLSGRP